MVRARLVSVELRLQVVADDGETLTPVPVDPVAITAAQVDQLDIPALLAQIEQQIQPPAES